jgi:ribosomal protein L21E
MATANIKQFKEGDRVKIIANEEEGWPEEVGTVLGYSGNDTYVVEVDEEYRDCDYDDGMREPLVDDIEKL